MKKGNDYLITKEATKYWKKAIKSDRVKIANYDGNIYILNGYNAFKFPAAPVYWDAVARPAFMCDMPADGDAMEYHNGQKRPDIAAEVAVIFDKCVGRQDIAAYRTQFSKDFSGGSLRIFKNGHGDITTINVLYDCLVDFSKAEKIFCNDKISPVCVSDKYGFSALLMPVRQPHDMPQIVRNTFAGLLEG